MLLSKFLPLSISFEHAINNHAGTGSMRSRYWRHLRVNWYGWYWLGIYICFSLRHKTIPSLKILHRLGVLGYRSSWTV